MLTEKTLHFDDEFQEKGFRKAASKEPTALNTHFFNLMNETLKNESKIQFS